METQVEQKINQLIENKQPIDLTSNLIAEAPKMSMIEEARTIRDDLIRLKSEIESERKKLDVVHANAILGGRSLMTNNEKSNEDIVSEEAKKILSTFYAK